MSYFRLQDDIKPAVIASKHMEQFRRTPHPKALLTSCDIRMREIFLSDTGSDNERYTELFRYFVEGFLYYLAPGNAHVCYPGLPSSNGAAIDAMEGFCRVLPMISAWISSGRPSAIFMDEKHQVINLGTVVKDGLVAGTDPRSKAFWGYIRNKDQRLVEAADVALSIWFLRESVWAQLSLQEKQRIANWLARVNKCEISDNAWHVFPIIVNEVLSALGYQGDCKLSFAHYQRLKSFYVGNGWFSDGVKGEFDYYNAWGIHYALHWLRMINPAFDPEFLDNSMDLFVRKYKYLISVEGIPITGRSVCYRMAAPAPVIAASMRNLGDVTPGMARQALDCIWRYFIKNNAVSSGKVTQGYWQEDARLLDNYSGPASCLWSLRSLVVALYAPPDSSFWLAAPQKLPIEEGNYEFSIPEIQWSIKGNMDTGNIQIIKENNHDNVNRKMQENTIFRKVVGWILGRPYRPRNVYIKYKLHLYNSHKPFFCAAED